MMIVDKFFLYFIVLVFMLFLDFIWLKFIIRDFFFNQISYLGQIENGKFVIKYIPAVLTYVFMALTIIIFVLPLSNSYGQAAMYGALLGFVFFAVFDLTNLSFIKDYPLKMVIVDILWGTFLLCVSSAFAFFVQSKFF